MTLLNSLRNVCHINPFSPTQGGLLHKDVCDAEHIPKSHMTSVKDRLVLRIDITIEDEKTDGLVYSNPIRIVLPEHIQSEKKFKRVVNG